MAYLKCEESAAAFVMNLFITNTGPRHSYHNLHHTIRVVTQVKEIAAFYKINESELCTLLMAAWFHDVGYLFDETIQPERISIIIMKGYLEVYEVAANLMEQASDLIRAIASQPRLFRLADKIICDAVTYDYGTGYLRETSFGQTAEGMQVLNNHVYYTEYCQLRLNRGKLQNIEWLKTLQ